MRRGAGALARDLPDAKVPEHEVEQRQLRARDANYQTAIFQGVKSAERDRAFTIDEAGDIGGARRTE